MQHDQVNIKFYSKGEEIGAYRHICFGRLCESGINKLALRSDKVTIIFPDCISRKGNFKVVDDYLLKLKEMGIYDKVAIRSYILELGQDYGGSQGVPVGTRIFEFSFNPSTVTAQEVFLFGSLSRMITLKRRPIVDWFKLMKKEPDRDEFHLFLIALATTYNVRKRSTQEANYHYLIYVTSTVLTGKNHVDFVKDMSEKYKPWGNTAYYKPSNGMSNYFIESTVTNGTVEVYGREVPLTVNRNYSHGWGYSKALVKSFFSKKDFIEFRKAKDS